jgi:hypothetical protein
MLNADLKKNVLSCFLKVDKTVCARRSAGSAFQTAGPAYEKERSLNFQMNSNQSKYPVENAAYLLNGKRLTENIN